MNFLEEANSLLKQYSNNIRIITDESTKMIFSDVFKNSWWQIKSINIKKLRKGCFYIIKYNYNGNKIWCPILTLDFKIKENKNILYCINFDYLPYKYKIPFVNMLFKTNEKTIEKNRDIENVLLENSIKLSFEFVYNWLKTNGNKSYSLTAFDVLKIEKIHVVSTTLIDRFIFLDTKYINKRMMLDTLEKIDDKTKKEEMKLIIEKYEKLLELYESDIELYYRSLRSFESNLKLYED